MLVTHSIIVGRISN